MKFNPPPGWPPPPPGWTPENRWRPDPSWPPAPPGWNFWVPEDPPAQTDAAPDTDQPVQPAQQERHSEPSTEAPGATAPISADTDAAGETRVASDAAGRPEVEQLRRQLEQQRSEAAQLRAQAETARAELAAARAHPATPAPDAECGAVAEDLAAARRELVELNDAVLLQQVGIYEYHHTLENADAYKERLADIRERIKDTCAPRRRSRPLTGSLTTIHSPRAER